MADGTVALRGDERSLAGARSASPILILADSALEHWHFSDGTANLGRPSITVRDPVEAFAVLHRQPRQIGVVLGPAHDPRYGAMEFFRAVREAFPHIRRLAFSRHLSECAEALHDGLLQGVVTCPAPPYWLSVAFPGRTAAAHTG